MKIALTILGILCSGTAQAYIHGGPAGLYVNSDGVNDGAVLSNVNSQFQSAGYFNSAPLSGQTYVVRPPWKVAGVDYRVGYDTTLTLKDPATATLPSGCSYLANGRSGYGHVPAVDCTVPVSGMSLVGYDFSGAASSTTVPNGALFAPSNGIMLVLEAASQGVCTIANNRFRRGSNFSQVGISLSQVYFLSGIGMFSGHGEQ